MRQLTTSWGRALDDARVRDEYPRPSLVRKGWMSLNGMWDFCVNRDDACGAYDARIRVPFPPEAALSGVGRAVGPEDVLHYRRRFTLPEALRGGRLLLHFGAVDQECEVFLNGTPLGGQQGGYLPFTLELTHALRAGKNTLEVRARDRTEAAPYARGKQRLSRKGPLASLFYTPVSGIWKSVWLERVPERYVTRIRCTPRYDEAAVALRVEASHPGMARARVLFQGKPVWEGELPANEEAVVPLPGFHPWSPEEPCLYDVEVEYGEDCVRSYFGMRKVEARPDGRGIPRFFLNGRPYFFNGVLDQGYWPDGLMTPPDAAAWEADIRAVKALGFNTLRMHIKVEEERFYYLCDRIGMAVWQDMPCGGGRYNMWFLAYLPNLLPVAGRLVRDGHYRLFARADAAGRAQFLRELEEMVDWLKDHPSVVLWTPFNEGWGQFDARQATARVRAIDPTRPVNEACGWFDQGGGDVYSIHNYFRRLRVRPKKGRVVALTEFGGQAYPEREHMACEREFSYRDHADRAALSAAYAALWERDILPNLARGLSAAIYTQLNDIEEEINGILTYDREVQKLDGAVVQDLNRRAAEAFEAGTRE